MPLEDGLKHTWLTGPWHYCARCDQKTKLRDMTWQRGLLLCNAHCVDRLLLGEREPKIAAVLTDGKEEFIPVEKIRNPDHFEEAEDFLI
jgi:hypothetical protein